MQIISLTNKRKGFYGLMGPFLAKRAIVKELGAHPWDDDGKVWTIGLDRGKVLGFVAHIVRGNVALLCSDFVLPENRSKGIYAALFERRMAILGAMPMRATATDQSREMYAKSGFKKIGKKGRYHLMARGINE